MVLPHVCISNRSGVHFTSVQLDFPPPPPIPTQTARRPNDSSPVSTGRLNKKSASFFFLSAAFPRSFLSTYFFFLACFLCLEREKKKKGSTTNRPAGVESGEGMRECRSGNPSLRLLTMKADDSSALCGGCSAEVHFPKG